MLTSLKYMMESILNKFFACLRDTFFLIADGIHKNVSEQNSVNEAGPKLLSLLPHQLFSCYMHTLEQHLNRHQIHLKPHFPEAEIPISKMILPLQKELITQDCSSRPFLVKIKVYPYHSKMREVLLDLNIKSLKVL